MDQGKQEKITMPAQVVGTPPPVDDGDLEDLLDGFDMDGIDSELMGAIPGYGVAPKDKPVEKPVEEQKEEEDSDPNVHRLEYESITMKKTPDGKKILNDFLTFEEKIGEGAFCRVLRAIGYYPASNEYVPYAMKEFRMSTLNQTVNNAQASNLDDCITNLGIRKLYDQVSDECKFWGTLKHDNVVKAFIWYEDYTKKHDKMYLMLQFADMGDIASWNSETRQYKPNQRLVAHLTKKLNEEEEFKQYGVPESASMLERVARFIFSQVANGLEYLHYDALVANRDLKPENIMFTTKEGGTNIFSHDRAQITDFTTVFKLKAETADIVKISGMQGSPAFMAPECIRDHEYKPRPLDVWALGVTIYAFMFGDMPFWNDNQEELNQQILNKELNFDDKEVSEEFKQMMRALLERDPEVRPTIREAKERFAWLKRPVFPSEQPDDVNPVESEEEKDNSEGDGFD